MRHASLEKNVIKVFLKFHILIQNGKGEIAVPKIKLKKNHFLISFTIFIVNSNEQLNMIVIIR